MRSVLFVLSLLVPCANANEWDDAEKGIVRLSPSDFKELPLAVSEEFRMAGCKIPQTPFYSKGDKVNVISGSFGAPGQKDYAVLCSIDGISHIRVVWGGPARCESELSPQEDGSYLQGVGDNLISYSRQIGKVTGREIAARQSEFGNPKPPTEALDGIEDMFLEKASGISLCVDGKWHGLFGSD